MSTPELHLEEPETITLVRGVPYTVRAVAIGTNGRAVPSARVTLDIVNEIAVDGDKLTAAPAGSGSLKLVATWHRSDGQTPTAERAVQITADDEEPAPPDEPTPEPEPEPEPEVPPVDPAPEDPPPDTEVPQLVARFTYATQGLTVNVDRTISTRPFGGGGTYWDFGDGSGERQGLARDSHTYAQPGRYPVTLRLDANAHPGLESSVTHDVTVADDGTAPPPPPPPNPPPPPGPTPTPPPIAGIPTMPVVRALTLDRKHTDRRAQGWDDIDIVKGSAAQYVPDPLGQRGTILLAPFGTGIRPGTSPIENVQTLGKLGLSEAAFTVGLFVDDDYHGNWSGENKQVWLGINSEGNNIFLTLRGSGTSALRPGIKMQGVVDPRRESMGEGYIQAPAIQRKRWYDLTVYTKMNTYLTPHRQVAGFGLQGDKADGVLALAVDGQLVGSVTDMNFTQSSTTGSTMLPKINSAMLDPTWGGGGAANPQLGHIGYDRLILTGR